MIPVAKASPADPILTRRNAEARFSVPEAGNRPSGILPDARRVAGPGNSATAPTPCIGRTSDGYKVFADGKVRHQDSQEPIGKVDLERYGKTGLRFSEDLYVNKGALNSLTADKMEDQLTFLSGKWNEREQARVVDGPYMEPIVAAYNHRKPGLNLIHATKTEAGISQALESLASGGDPHRYVLCSDFGHYKAYDFFRHPQGGITVIGVDPLIELSPGFFLDRMRAGIPKSMVKNPIEGVGLYGLRTQALGCGCGVMSLDICKGMRLDQQIMEGLHQDILDRAKEPRNPASPARGGNRNDPLVLAQSGDAFENLPISLGKLVHSNGRLMEMLKKSPGLDDPVNSKGESLVDYRQRKTEKILESSRDRKPGDKQFNATGPTEELRIRMYTKAIRFLRSALKP